MIRTYHKDVLAAANAEGLEDVVTGGAGFKRRVLRVYGESIAEVDLRVYRDNDRILEVAGEVLAEYIFPVDIDMELREGETLKVGWNNGTASPVTHAISIQVEEVAVG